MNRTDQIRAAALAAAYGETIHCPEPSEPTQRESVYLAAIECFRNGQICLGYDYLDLADADV